MIVSLVVAMDENRVIGRGGALPWHLPADLKRFRQITMGHPMIMGRKTFDSIGRILPGRRSIVITRNAEWKFEGAERANSLDEALRIAGDVPEVCVIGGAGVFRLAIPRANRLYLTRVVAGEKAPRKGDVLFPEMDFKDWKLVRQEKRSADERNPHDMTFEQWDKVTRKSNGPKFDE